MSNPVIINLVTNTGWYPRGQERLRKSANEFAPEIPFIGYFGTNHVKSPSHQDVPYGFKAFAIQDAVSLMYDRILWLDAACWLQKPPTQIMEKIEKDGHLFYVNCSVGEWTNDYCLDHFGITRDESMRIPMIQGCFLGLNMSNPNTAELQARFLDLAVNRPDLFRGPANNHNGEASPDLRCRGHRWDQSVLSILIHQANVKNPGVFKLQHRRAPEGSRPTLFSEGHFEYVDHLLFEYYYNKSLPHAEIITQGM